MVRDCSHALRSLTRRARREWFTVLTRPNGERIEWFHGCAFKSQKAAAKAAGEANARRDTKKYGIVSYDFIDRPASTALVGRIVL